MPPDEPSFTVEDLRRLTDEIGPGEHAAVVLVEHRWAPRLRELVRARGGHLVAPGLLTPHGAVVEAEELLENLDDEPPQPDA